MPLRRGFRDHKSEVRPTVMIKVAMILGHDLLIPNEDTRVYREALSLVKAGYEVTVF